MVFTNEQLIAGITRHLYDAFTLSDDTDSSLIDEVSANILQYVQKNMHKQVQAHVHAPVPHRESKIQKSAPKGNTYSQFVSMVSAVARGEEIGNVKITVIKRVMTAKASELIIGHEEELPYGQEITVRELFERINSFETRSMNRASLMWNLLSDSDRTLLI